LAAITGQPAYRQVANDLRGKVRAGRYAPGDALPSTAQLRDAYQVSITVVRAAINQLRAEGLVIGQPGKGVFVADTTAVPPEDDDLAEIRRQIETLRSELVKLNDRLARVEQRVVDSPRQRRK
jgi:GntR family transcriptional regulator